MNDFALVLYQSDWRIINKLVIAKRLCTEHIFYCRVSFWKIIATTNSLTRNMIKWLIGRFNELSGLDSGRSSRNRDNLIMKLKDMAFTLPDDRLVFFIQRRRPFSKHLGEGGTPLTVRVTIKGKSHVHGMKRHRIKSYLQSKRHLSKLWTRHEDVIFTILEFTIYDGNGKPWRTLLPEY